MTDLTPIIESVVALFAAIITAFVVPWIKRKTSQQDRDELLKWVDIAVAAAEQLFDSNKGPQKKKYVVSFLEERGFFTFSDHEIDRAIEASVLRLHRGLEATA